MMAFLDSVTSGAGRVTRAAFSVIGAVLAVVLAWVVIVSVLAMFAGGSGQAQKKEAEEKPLSLIETAESCECRKDEYCTGPKGGRYCIDGGKKRYR